MAASIHQFVPMLHRFDAVGNHVTALAAALREEGVESSIFVENFDEETRDLTAAVDEYEDIADEGDLLVYHHATASRMAAWLADRRQRLAVVYHNVTPAAYFVNWDSNIAAIQTSARRELRVLGQRAIAGIADSEFNRGDLVASGFSRSVVLPPVLEVPVVDSGPRAEPGERRGDGGGERVQWLCVGRLAPNKCVERVIAALDLYRKTHDDGARLIVVGRDAVPAYGDALRSYASELDAGDSIRFAARVDDDELASLYRESDVLVLASEHEGFCVPLVEAMAAGMPVVAYASGAVPEVLGDAGILVGNRAPSVMADAVARARQGGRTGVSEACASQLAVLGLRDARVRYVDTLLSLREGPS